MFRCDTDGLNLFQLTERDDDAGTPSVRLSLDGKYVYATWSGDTVLYRIDVETGRTEDVPSYERYVASLPMSAGISLAGGNDRVFLSVKDKVRQTGMLVRYDLATGEATEFGADTKLYGYDYRRDRLVIIRNLRKLEIVENPDGSRRVTNTREDSQSLWSTDLEGGDARRVSTTQNFGHSTMLGTTGLIQGTGVPPDRCIWIDGDGGEPYKLAQGPYFWHAGGSFDGEWTVADTNWPDVGLQLVNIPARRFRTLCHARASQDHSQRGHPHPGLSPDGRVCVFSSDRTGVSQVYVAHIAGEFRESVVR